MDITRHIGKLDRSLFHAAHNDTVYCQPLFERVSPEETDPPAFAYPPCWAILDPGMSVEPHQHAIAELYVFVSGGGMMRLDTEQFEVEAGMAVNIPPNAVHSVANSPSAAPPLIWVSIGLRETQPE